jgi:signal transduction histidine kinase
MRQVACNALEADGVQVDLHFPSDGDIDRIGLASDRRRQLLLAFKEVLTNVARHARASQVRIDLAVHGGTLRLAVHDNGRGFDVSSASRGQGLDSLGRRAAELHGRLTIDSRPGWGTHIELRVPLK